MYSELFKIVQKVPAWVWLGGAAGVALYIIKKGSLEAAAQGAVAGVVGQAGSVVIGGAEGVILGLGDAIGLPRTDLTKCQQAMKAGDNWRASYECDASTFLAWQRRGITSRFEDLFN